MSAFVQTMDDGGADALSADERAALTVALEAAFDAGQTAWPGLDVSAELYGPWLAERVVDSRELASLDTTALYLTCAVLHGRPGASEALQDAFGSELYAALTRFGLQPAARDDVAQIVLSKLVAPPEPKIAGYSGRGTLANWLRAVAVRQAISESRRRGPMERVVAEPSPHTPDFDADPELSFLKEQDRNAFKAAFAEVLGGLDAADRTLLQLRFVEGSTLDQLARLRGVHRATIARQLARLRRVVLEGLLQRVGTTGASGGSERANLLALIESNLDLSLPRLLAP